MKKTTAIYVRVSHRDQTHASQLPDLERWAEAHDGPFTLFSATACCLQQGASWSGWGAGETVTKELCRRREAQSLQQGSLRCVGLKWLHDASLVCAGDQ